MLNLLLISDNSKVEYLKGVLQPELKVLIDLAADFDQGLKDVFDKRPAVVCIQEQIGGVAGESVARHIQMLLGNSAPLFILLHCANANAKPIKGLYEYLIDLNQPNEALTETVKNTLALMLGDEWDKIHILSKQTSVQARPVPDISEAVREAADKLVDDFLNELEKPGLSVSDNPASLSPTQAENTAKVPDTRSSETFRRTEVSPGTVESERAQAINDDLAEILSSFKSTTEKPPSLTVERMDVPLDAAPDLPSPMAQKSPVAEFRINQKSRTDEAHTPDDLLLEFDGSYRSRPLFLRRSVIVVTLCAIFAAGGWYLVSWQQLPVALLSWFKPASVAKPIQMTPSAAVPVEKTLASNIQKPIKVPVLPAFIPKDGLDTSFSSKNPGWERYVGKTDEFRLFTASGRLQAIQVLALKDGAVSDALIKTVLNEFAGTNEYQISKRTVKSGIHVERGKILNKGELVFYRKSGVVKAFVVSVN